MRGRILKRGEQLFLSRGFNGFSYADISKELGVKNAAIHYHFPSKKDLIVAILNQDRQRFQNWREEIDLNNEEIIALYEMTVAEIYEKRLLKRLQVCVIGNSAMAYDHLPIQAINVAKALIDDIVDWFTAILDKGKRDGVIRLTGSSADEAKMMAATLLGGLQLARLAGKDFFYVIKDQLKTKLIND